MKIAIISGYGGLDKIKYQTSEKPKPKKGELTIKVEAFGLNPKDILIRKGKFKNLSGNHFPQYIGFEFSGIIIQADLDSKYKPGDKVFGLFNGWNGKCSAEYITISEKLITKLPDNIGFSQASGVSLAGLTALQSLRDKGKIISNMSVCINGASGGVGTLAIQIAKSFGAKIVAITSFRNKDFCLSLGADEVIDYTKNEIANSKLKFDLFFDVFGNYTFNKIRHCLNKNGIYITTVPSKNIIIQQFYNFFRTKKAKLIIVKSKQKDLEWLASKINHQQIHPIVDKTFPFKEIVQAQAYIETKRAKGKVIITINNQI
jgi:NADPH:quinone reductase-like Zn-dependent oxidoreductase